MDESMKTYIKTNAFLGYNIIIDNNIGVFKCPKIDDLGENLTYYIYFINKYIDLYEDDKLNFYNVLLSDNANFREFVTMLYLFFDTESIKFKDKKIIIGEQEFNKDKQQQSIVEYFIDETNISVFMECLRILHHFDKKDDGYLPANKIAAEMMTRARKLKKEIESKIKNKDGIGFLEILSTVSIRHSSINPINISQLNYFQIIDQYKRLLMFDLYMPCLQGNATEEYVKNNNVKHYGSKIINE